MQGWSGAEVSSVPVGDVVPKQWQQPSYSRRYRRKYGDPSDGERILGQAAMLLSGGA